ncbi:MAG: pentapeptide repeat-containing protein [Knoellia sp.]
MFLGKWVLGQGSTHVVVDPASGVLRAGAPPSDHSDRFNADGTDQAFRLRSGLDGRYVVGTGTTYAATSVTPDAANWFTLRSAGVGAAVFVVDLSRDRDHPTNLVWSIVAGGVVPVDGAAPPASSQFDQTVVTVGLSQILAQGITNEPDLSWADLHGTDLSAAHGLIDLSKSDLTGADLSGVTFSSGTGFQKARATGLDLRHATMPHAILGEAGLQQAHLDDAKLVGADLSGADCTGATFVRADLTDSTNLAHAVFAGAVMTDAILVRAANIYQTSFVGATLTRVDFTGSSVTGKMDISGADLTGATLNNPVGGGLDIYPGNLVINAQTKFPRARIQRLDLSGYDLRKINFSGADLTGCLLDQSQLDGANLGFAVLDHTTITGGVGMHGTNLSSASLRQADLTGAQLGAVGEVFRVGSDQPTYGAFRTALDSADAAVVTETFASAKHPLTAPVAVRQSTFAPDRAWSVQGGGVEQTFSVFLESMSPGSTAKSLTVYRPTLPAVLTNAFLVDADLKSANLFGVRASGAQLYATQGHTVNLNKAIIEGLQANNANLGRVDLSQASLTGVNFDYAVLTGAKFIGATVSVDSMGGQPSFNGANLQGADFTGATLRDVILSNAAVAVADPFDAAASAGVWLFSLPPDQAVIAVPELQAATKAFSVPTAVLPQMQATGAVPVGVATSFRKAGITLSGSALLAVLTIGVYWRVSDGSNSWVVFRTVDNDYSPALGVASGTAYTVSASFFLPLSLMSACGNGAVAASIRSAFEKAGHPLAPTATMTTDMTPESWQVIDGATTYTLWLSFSSSVRGVDTTITVRSAIATVVSLFGGSSVPLSAIATVTSLRTKGWRISNDAEDPFSSARGYIEFTALPSADGGLDVYGRMIRIVRSSGPGQEEFVNVPCAITILPASVLSPGTSTICPNGAPVSANTSSGLPYDQWMWARFLARPPFCVPDPDGNFICPI